MHRTILAGSVIIGIAVMMILATVPTSYAMGGHWKQGFRCAFGPIVGTIGTVEELISLSCAIILQNSCTHQSQEAGRVWFNDLNGNNIADENEKIKCFRR